MAKQRIVNTHFWRDNFILGLKPDERLLFLWVITNPATDLCGAYEAAMPTIELETGLKAKRIREIFDTFEASGKILYRNGWVIIRNFTKHQNGTSTNVKKGAERSLNACPDWIKDTLSKGTRTDPNQTLPEPEPEPEPEPIGRESETPLSLPPADFTFEDSAFEHPAVQIYEEKFQVKIKTNFAKAVADRVKNMAVWIELINDKIAWADEPLQKRQDVAKWFLKAYDERLAEKQNGPPGRKGQPTAIVPIRPAMNEIDFQKRLMEQQPK
jgi:hypothetical protein